MGYYSDDRNNYKRQRKPENSYINPYYGQISYTDPTLKQSQSGKYLRSTDSSYDIYPEEVCQEQPRRRARKKIRVPSIYIGGLKIKLPSLQVFALLAAAIAAVLLKATILIYGIGGLSFFAFLNMSGARYHRLVVPQRAFCMVITIAMIVLAGFDISPGFGPSGGNNISLNGNINNQPPIATVTPLTEATQPPTIATEPPTVPTEPPTEPKPKRLSHDGIDLDMPLYYNENGGNYYHTTDMCSSVGEDYLPLTGTLIYEELSVGKFKSLKRCTTCSAPVRPHTH